ncbi:MAG TPA: prenyltransferase [Sphaerochaeta sp.]|jgi:1,4-dihydroxy-2-naphthoate octaprenyltransferase|nr:prenyltransferase [Sphaerochaeta sp.]
MVKSSEKGFTVVKQRTNRYYTGMKAAQFFHIVEMRTKIISMGTFFCASIYALSQTGSVKPVNALVMGLATLFIDMGTTGFNTFFDYWRGVDNALYTKEPDKVLVHQAVSPIMAFLVSLALFALAALLGLYLACLTSWNLILVGGVCMLVGFFYTGGPLPISRTPFGEVFAGFFLGTMLFLITLYVQGVPPSVKHVVVTVPFLLMIGMILSVNNGCDLVGDKASGRKTLAILLGSDKAFGLIAVEGLGAYAISFLLVILGYHPSTLAFCLVPSLVLYSKALIEVKKAGLDAEHKSVHMQFASKSYLHFCLAFIAAYALSIGSSAPAS